MSVKIIKIRTTSQEKIRGKVLAIAKGELKPKASDQKIWFTLVESLANTLNKQSK